MPEVTRHRERVRVRRRLRLGALAVIGYAIAVVVFVARSGSTGFVTLYGGSVLAVESGSVAEEAGVRAGDMVLAVNGAYTETTYLRYRALANLEPGSQLRLTLRRGDDVFDVSYQIPRKLPLGSAAGSLLAAALLALAILADKGGAQSPTRSFYRSGIVYVVFLAGTFAWDTMLSHPTLAVPWILSLCLAAPVTCHFMLQFPAGPAVLSRRTVAWLYIPPLVIGCFQLVNFLVFRLGASAGTAARIARYGGTAIAASAAAYLTIGAIARARRLRQKRDQIDPVAVRFLQIGGVAMAAPLVVGTLVATRDLSAFVGGGFRPYVATAMVGGSICVVIALAREQFGDLDRFLRRGTGQLIAYAVAAAAYLAVATLLGSAGTLSRMGPAAAALSATVVAALVFGPVRARVQSLVDERFSRERARARALLRDASEVALRTLDVDALESGTVVRVRDALGASGVALYEARAPSPLPSGGGWHVVAEAGVVSLGDELPPRDPVASQIEAALAASEVREVSGGVLCVPIPLSEPPQAALLIAPGATRPLDEEDHELVATLCAGLAVAMANARAHSELRGLSEKLAHEVEVAEKRRREIARLKERIEEEKQVLEAELSRRGGRAPVIGLGLRPTFELVQKVAKSDVTVLVSGETGVGKELVARAIHAASPRRGGPFVVVDCASIPAGLIESALFGHEKGSFTGATRAAQGAFRAAHGGTIFLDEIGELPLDLQPKLLRVLQEREVRPVGADRTQPVDVRVVAGTNRDLTAEVSAGRYREDLLYRLRVVEIDVPPLRARKRDIPELAETFLRAYAEQRGQPPKRLSAAALTALLDYDWPGNVRELEHALEAAALYADGEDIGAGDLKIQEELFRRKAERAVAVAGEGGTGLRETLEGLERERLMETLRAHGGNRSAAAKALGLSRGALLRRLARYGIDERQ